METEKIVKATDGLSRWQGMDQSQCHHLTLASRTGEEAAASATAEAATTETEVAVEATKTATAEHAAEATTTTSAKIAAVEDATEAAT